MAFFPRGVERLKGIKEWHPVAEKMATDQGPYFAFLDRTATELEPLIKIEGLPYWLQQVYHFRIIKALSKTQKEGGILDKAAEEGKKLISQLEKILGKEVGQTETQFQAAKAYQEYLNALATLSQTTGSRNQAFQLASQVFSEDPAVSKSSLFAASGALNKLKANMMRGKPAEEVFWRMVAGPLNFLWTFVRRETASSLQNQWEEKVLAEVQGMLSQQQIQLLLGPDGLVWKFLKGPAAPFISKSTKGYYSKEVLGGAVPFDTPFLNYVTKGALTPHVKKSGTVVIRGLPTDANPEAKVRPRSTKLELQCTSGNQTIINYHYPVSKTFQWSLDTCTDVLFQIEVGSIILIKKYTGSQAFIEFLQDFKGGQRTFSPSEFPGEKAALENLEIKYIKVNYQFSGDYQSLVETIKSIPGHVPGNIVKSWEQ
jgi:type VI secretion system protein ImpL